MTGRSDPTNVNTADPNFVQPGLVPTGGETHSGEDVPMYAIGASARLFRGTVEQSYIGFTTIERANLNSPR